MRFVSGTFLVLCIAGSMAACARHVMSAEYHEGHGEYLIVGIDAPETHDELMRLADAHWDYIDRFAPQLVARGPLISDDGTRHLGSVHVIKASSFADAERFASEEPYNAADVYSRVTVTAFGNILGHTMWERPPARIPDESTFIRAHWPATFCSATQAASLRSAVASGNDFAFFGLLTTADGMCNGIAAGAYLSSGRAVTEMERLLDVSEIAGATLDATTRWRRGGRER